MSLSRLFLLLASLVGTGTLHAQPEFTGFIRNYTGLTPIDGPQWRVARTTVRLDTDVRYLESRLFGSIQADENRLQNAIDASLSLRELYVDSRAGAFDLRLGRFLHSFGRSDGVILSDVFSSYDLSEFLTQDPTDLKRGIDGLRLAAQFGSNSVQILASPFKPVSSLPEGDWAVAEDAINGIPVQTTSRGNSALDAGPMRAALLVSLRPTLNWDVDLAVGHWSYPVDSYAKSLSFRSTPFGNIPDGVTLENRTSNSFLTIASTEYRVTPIVGLTAEVAYWLDRETDILPTDLSQLEAENPNRFLRTAPFLQSLFGAKTVWMGYNVAAQVFMEHFLREPEFMMADRTVFGGSFSLFRRFWYDDLTLRLFTRIQHDPSGFWANPEALYRVSDSVQLRLGGHHFGGPIKSPNDPTFSFSQYRPNSFLYSKLAFYW
ncbi:MAG: hypothetical protein RL177_891 [Bacteroidota bacterium]